MESERRLIKLHSYDAEESARTQNQLFEPAPEFKFSPLSALLSVLTSPP